MKKEQQAASVIFEAGQARLQAIQKRCHSELDSESPAVNKDWRSVSGRTLYRIGVRYDKIMVII